MSFEDPGVSSALAQSGPWYARNARPQQGSFDVKRQQLIGADVPESGAKTNPRVVMAFMADAMENRDETIPRYCGVWMATHTKPCKGVQLYPALGVHSLNLRLAAAALVGHFKDVPTVESVMENYAYMGAMASGRGDGEFGSGTRSMVVDRQNCYGQMSNVWGEGAKPGRYLWFVVGYVPMGRGLMFNPVQQGSVMKHFHPARADGQALPFPGHIVQVRGVVTVERYISAAELCTEMTMPNGMVELHYGHAVRVGCVSQGSGGCELNGLDTIAGLRDATMLARAPLLDIIVSTV